MAKTYLTKTKEKKLEKPDGKDLFDKDQRENKRGTAL